MEQVDQKGSEESGEDAQNVIKISNQCKYLSVALAKSSKTTISVSLPKMMENSSATAFYSIKNIVLILKPSIAVQNTELQFKLKMLCFYAWNLTNPV